MFFLVGFFPSLDRQHFSVGGDCAAPSACGSRTLQFPPVETAKEGTRYLEVHIHATYYIYHGSESTWKVPALFDTHHFDAGLAP